MANQLALLSPVGDPLLITDEAVNDSDKSFYVPLGFVYDVEWIWVELTTTATVGNREVTVEIQDAVGDVVGQIQAAGVQAASLSHEYMFGQGLTQYDGGDATKHHVPLPKLYLPQRFTVRVYDAAAVDAAADDMVVQMVVSRRWISPIADDSIVAEPGRAARLTISTTAPAETSEDVWRVVANASLTITGFAPLGGDWINSLPAKADLTITGQTPTVVYRDREPAKADLTVSGYPPTAVVST